MAEQELLRQIETKVGQARRRQTLALAALTLPITLAIGLLAAAAWAIAEPWLNFRLLPWVSPAAAVGLALVAMGVWVWLRLPTRVHAALALDRAFDLKERMTTAVSLDPTLRHTPAGQALLEDARGHLQGLNVGQRFPLRLEPRGWLAPLGAALALVVATFFAPTPGGSQQVAAAPKPEPILDQIDPLKLQAIKKANEERQRRIAQLDDEKLKELQANFDKLVAALDKLDKPAEAQLALQEVTRLSEQVQRRQDELAKSLELKRKLMGDQALKQPPDAPTRELQKALANGDLNKAKEEVQKLAEKLKNKELSEEDKQKLAEGLKDLQEKLRKIAEQKEKMEQLAKSNLDPETMEREMAKLRQEIGNMQDLAKLAEMMEKAQQAMQNGDPQQAMNDLADMAQMLEDMGLDEKMLTELELAECDLEEIRDGLG